jgi:hypothetical protein
MVDVLVWIIVMQASLVFMTLLDNDWHNLIITTLILAGWDLGY